MGTTISRWWIWTAANLMGMAFFLYLTIPTWIEPELAEEPEASGVSIVWGLSALPILVLFMLAHFVFGFVAHSQARRGNGRQGEILLGVTLVCWIATFFYDGAHHGA